MDSGVVRGQLDRGLELVAAGGAGDGDDAVRQLLVNYQFVASEKLGTAHVTTEIQKR